MFIAPKTLSDVAAPFGVRFGLRENYLHYWLDREKIYHYKNEIHNTNRLIRTKYSTSSKLRFKFLFCTIRL